MKDWKQAFRLAKFELRASLSGLLLACSVSAIYCVLFYVLPLDPYSKKDPMILFDIFFLISFTLFPVWCHPKDFALTKNMGAPGVQLLLALPAEKDAIAKSRMIIHLVYSVVFQIPLLIAFYLSFPSVQENLGPFGYLSFALVWLCFSMYAGTWLITTEFGLKKTYSNWAVTFSAVLLLVLVAAFYKGITWAAGSGLVYATIAAAKHWPLAAGLLSLFLAATGLHFIHQYNLKTLKKVDYL